jgi:hypothetical protein
MLVHVGISILKVVPMVAKAYSTELGNEFRTGYEVHIKLVI